MKKKLIAILLILLVVCVLDASIHIANSIKEAKIERERSIDDSEKSESDEICRIGLWMDRGPVSLYILYENGTLVQHVGVSDFDIINPQFIKENTSFPYSKEKTTLSLDETQEIINMLEDIYQKDTVPEPRSKGVDWLKIYYKGELLMCDLPDFTPRLAKLMKKLQSVAPKEMELDYYVDVLTMLGDWSISYAKNMNTHEEYPLQEFYGSGIKYGGTLTLNEDGTFSRYIGITTDETEKYEGTFTHNGTYITFRYYDGTTAEAKYLPETNEIKYTIKDSKYGYIDEYYNKK